VTDVDVERAEPGVRPPAPSLATGLFRLGIIAAIIVFLSAVFSWWVAAIILALVVMITLHEAGHYVTARWSGMKATEFFLGFGPRIFSFRRGETEFGLKPVLVGAYVKIIGMNNLDQVDPADEPRTYRQQSYPKRLLVASAGSLVHFTLALIIFFSVFAFWGKPGESSTDWTVRQVSAGTAAAQAGIRAGDRIVSLDGQPAADYEAAQALIRARPNQSVELGVLRNGSVITIQADLGTNPDNAQLGFLGIAPKIPVSYQSMNPISAVAETGRQFGSTAKASVQGLGKFFSPSGFRGFYRSLTTDTQDLNRPVSPIGATQVGVQTAQYAGVAGFLLFFATINVFVGLLNLTPLPPFDGGHVAVATYEAIRSRNGKRYRVDMTKLLPVAYAVVALLAVVGLGSLYLDIVKGVG
jgi:membrane-associated protease RseP (regulator of RpoE activity)